MNESTAVAVRTNNTAVRVPLRGNSPSRALSLEPQNFAELMEFATAISKSTFIPKEYIGRPGDIVACVQYGREIGLAAMQSLQSICVINGKPSVYGDTALALVRNARDITGKRLLEEFEEGLMTAPDNSLLGAWCKSKRYGYPAVKTEFTIEDAKKAQLWGKVGPWQTYPKRMLKFRARGFNLRDNFADVLKGLVTAEEAMDYIDVESSPIGEARDPEHAVAPPSRIDALRQQIEQSTENLRVDPEGEAAKQDRIEAGKRLKAVAKARGHECNSYAAILTLVAQLVGTGATVFHELTAEEIDAAAAKLAQPDPFADTVDADFPADTETVSLDLEMTPTEAQILAEVGPN